MQLKEILRFTRNDEQMHFKSLRILGMMSGTSLDGLDLALCDFWVENRAFKYKILQTQTYEYPKVLAQKLRVLLESNALYFCQTEVEFSNYMAQCIIQFLEKTEKKPIYIASHGHTVFHQPEMGLTKQIGSGAILASKTGISTICDFRTGDVALGGQGAPLVPIGDALLFAEYDGCLNLGGISNISKGILDNCTAYDISLCNIPLNFLAEQREMSYDKNGMLAQKGTIHPDLLEALNRPDYFLQNEAKSIGFEFFAKYYKPLLESYSISVEDKLRTMCEHIALQIAHNFNRDKRENCDEGLGKVLVTGGGAKNNFLINLIKEKTKTQIIIPSEQLIDFKEALVFAFLGYLRVFEANNCLQSVTGALKDSCGGAIYSS
jgi:anhydro-N-acetylmuramic acid kinase